MGYARQRYIHRNFNYDLVNAVTDIVNGTKTPRYVCGSELPQNRYEYSVILFLWSLMSLAVTQVHNYLSRFRKYDWLWKEDKDVQYKRFVASNPAISDYEVTSPRLGVEVG